MTDADSDFVMSEEVQTEYERGRADGITHMRSLADDVLARALADELEIEALKARVEDLKRRLEARGGAPSVRPNLGGANASPFIQAARDLLAIVFAVVFVVINLYALLHVTATPIAGVSMGHERPKP